MGLLAAQKMQHSPVAALAPLLLLGLVALFARERHQRLQHLVALNDGLRHQAFHDEMTGLPNRILAVDGAEQMLARARRNNHPGAALYIDLDGFEQVNDGYGHASGDELLRLTAERLATLVREGDTAARLAGEEFLVLLEAAPDGGLRGGRGAHPRGAAHAPRSDRAHRPAADRDRQRRRRARRAACRRIRGPPGRPARGR